MREKPDDWLYPIPRKARRPDGVTHKRLSDMTRKERRAVVSEIRRRKKASQSGVNKL